MSMHGGFHMHRMRFDESETTDVSWHLLPRIAAYYRPYLWALALVFLAIVVQAGLNLIPPLLQKAVIDMAIPAANLRLLFFLSVGWVVSAVVSGLVSVGESYLNNWIGFHIIRDMRNRMYEHLQLLPLSFFNDARTGEVISRLNNDVNGIQGVVTGTVTSTVSNIVNIIFLLVTIFAMNWKLALLGMGVVPLFVIPTRLVGKVRWRIARATHEKHAEISGYIQEHLGVSGAILGKIFVRHDDEARHFRTLSDQLATMQLKESLVGRWFFMAVRTFSAIGPALIFWYGGYLVVGGEMSLGAVIAFIAYLNRLYSPVSHLSNLHVDITRSMALFERIFQYLDMPTECPGNEDLPALPKVKGNISFENGYFRYDGGPQVLRDVSLQIEAGQLVALVGPSGAGKTTITNLVPRLYEIQEGAIFIDGHDIREVSLTSLRRQIGMVTQDTFLFNATVRENLLYARPSATEEEMVAAAKAAFIHDLIMSLPDGYESMVGERGVKLSGGEKQRIAIARVILKDPRLFILDEATSSLDSLAEQTVQQALAPLLVGRTSLVIAHRLSTILAADLILVVEEGRVVESGTHAQLLRLNGLYTRLYEQQFLPQAHGGLKAAQLQASL